MEVVFLMSVVTAAIAYVGSFIRSRANRRPDFADWFVLAFGTINGLGFAFVAWATDHGLNNSQLMQVARSDAGLLSYYAPLAWIFLFSLWIGATISSQHRKVTLDIMPGDYPQWRLRRLQGFAWVLTIVAVLTYWLYARAYGGFQGLLAVGRYIRSATFYLLPNNPWSFLRPFGGFSLFASLIFWGLLLGRNLSVRKSWSIVGFVISFVWSIFWLTSRFGRVGLAVYMVTFPLSYGFMRARSHIAIFGRTAILMLLVLVMLSVSDGILGTGKGDSDKLRFFAKELSFPFITFAAQVDTMQLRYMKDVLASPLYFLPQRIWGGWFGLDTASQAITVTVMGAQKGEGGVTGGMPVDIVTFGFMQLGVTGVVIVGVLWGWLLVWVERRLIMLRLPKEVAISVYAFMLLQFAALTALYGDPEHIIGRNFGVFVGLAGLCLMLYPWSRHPDRRLEGKSAITGRSG